MKIGEYKKPTTRELRKFGIVSGLIFIGVFGLLAPLWRHRQIPIWPYVPGVPLAVLGLLVPAVLGPVHRVWMLAGGVLGWVNTRVILGVVFFILLTPLGLLRRLFGKDSMDRRPDPRCATYRTVTVPLPRERMKEPF